MKLTFLLSVLLGFLASITNAQTELSTSIAGERDLRTRKKRKKYYYYRRVPTFMHTCRMNDGITEEDLDKYDFGSYKMITVEKGESLYVTDPTSAVKTFRNAERKMIKTCKMIKERFPHIKCMIYYNALLNWRYYDMAYNYRILQGVERSIPGWRLNGDPTFPDSQNLDVFDFRFGVAQDWFVSSIRCDVQSNSKWVDGIFLDRAYLGRYDKYEGRRVKAGRNTLFPKYFEEYTTGKNELLTALADSGITTIINPSRFWYKETNDYTFSDSLQDASFIHMEYFCVSYESIFQVNQAVRAGKGVQAHASGHARGCQADKRYCKTHFREFLSTFLVAVEDQNAKNGYGEPQFACHEYWSLDRDEEHNNEYLGWGEYDLKLGVPNARQTPDGEPLARISKDGNENRDWGAYRAFTNRVTKKLQAVAVWTDELKTVCFVNDCTRNMDPENGKYCEGNHPSCPEILETMRSRIPE